MPIKPPNLDDRRYEDIVAERVTNPGGVPNQLIGVFSEELLEPLANVMQKLGSRHVLVVHSRDGMDEISIGDKTEIEVFNGPHTINGQGTYDFLHRHLDWAHPEARSAR